MMTTELFRILDFMGKAFVHIWPYLLITIPVAIAVNMSGAAAHIKKAFDAGPSAAIFLATLIGAFSPFCSCGVIPVIASLLLGGVPLPPVMAFWIASPSMDPEIFFLSVGTIGWDLAVWRLGSTLILSLGAGFITHLLIRAGWIHPKILKRPPVTARPSACCAGDAMGQTALVLTSPCHDIQRNEPPAAPRAARGSSANQLFWERLIRESLDAICMVAKFMALAFFLEALIVLYIPQEWVIRAVGSDSAWGILASALLGIPVYTSSLSALPMVSALLEQGMSTGAALAFLISGPVTTLPAMAAVWALVRHRIFILYLAYCLLGAILLGYANRVLGSP